MSARAAVTRPLAAAGRPLAAALGRPLGAVRAVRLSRRARRRLLALAVACLALAGLYVGWFRDSSFVSIERVTIDGVTTRDAQRLRAALAGQARSMTTLHVDRARLERATAGYPAVRALRVSTDFPHALHIEVVEHHAAAVAISGSVRVPVAGDGTVLRGLPVEGRLPEVRLRGGLPGERLREGPALRAARVLGGAPVPLRARLEGVREAGAKGLTVRMREGPDLIFGDASRLRAKWLAAARVMADPSSKGATYIDVRLPDRPAAGGVAAATLDPVAPGSAAAAAPGAAPQGAVAPGGVPQQTLSPAAPSAPGATAPGAGAAQPQTGTPQALQPQAGAGGGATANPQP